MSTVQTVIIDFIRENFIMGRSEVTIDPNESLIESGIMDSTGVLELVEFIEATYRIKVKDEEVIPQNLETISNIIRFLKIKDVE